MVKPDFGVRGGFERHLVGLIAGLTDRGWPIEVVEIDGASRPNRLYGLPVETVWLEHHDEYFHHLALVERTQHLDLDRFDVVLTTQPPTYLAPHRCKVALFYHHARQFYDLAEPFMASGFVDRELHEPACRAVRTLERPAVADVRRWLAGSAEVAARLDRYWSIPADRIAVHHAPPTTIPAATTAYRPGGPIVSVGRHEWPKRTELVVAAMHLTRSDATAHLVGSGSRLDYARSLDAELARHGGADGLSDERLWLNRGIFTSGWQPSPDPASGRVVFEGDLDDGDRDALYDRASMVVAPAYREDYGLTVLEAMARGRPVIVCDDGGGLTEHVVDGVTGLVVPPRPATVAAAIDRLVADPALAARLGAAGRDAVAAITMDRAVDQVASTLEAAWLQSSSKYS